MHAVDLQKILVAEDHAASRHMLERYLIRWGFEVVSAGDGVEALHLLDAPGAPCIALLDASLPRMDGLEVCRRIRSRAGRAFQYLLLFSAPRGAAPHAEDFHQNADDWIQKPFEVGELHARLRLARRVVGLERGVSRSRLAPEWPWGGTDNAWPGGENAPPGVSSVRHAAAAHPAA
jgi:DNA-binding response OmpR family regulator